jgi:hypothetical protein
LRLTVVGLSEDVRRAQSQKKKKRFKKKFRLVHWLLLLSKFELERVSTTFTDKPK